VVQDVEVLVDGLGCDLFSQPFLERLVGKVHPDDDCPPDIVPELLHCCIVDEMEVVSLHEDTGRGYLVGHEPALAHGYSPEVTAFGVVHRYPPLDLDDL